MNSGYIICISELEYRKLKKFAEDSGMRDFYQAAHHCIKSQLIKEGYMKGRKGVEK